MKNLKTLLPLAKKHVLELCVGFVFMLLQNYGYMKAPASMQKALDEITGSNNLSAIWPELLLILFYTALTVISMFLMRKLIISASRKVEYELRAMIYRKLLAVDMAFFQKHETGDLVSRCTNDLNAVRLLLGPGVMYIPNSLSRLVFFLPVLISLSRPLMFTVLVVLFLIVLLILTIMPRLRPLFQRLQEYVGTINNRVWQVVSGITTIKLYSLEDIETDRFKTLNREYIRRHMAIVKIRGFLWPLFIFIFSLTELIILLIGGRQVIQGEMTIGQLLQFNVMVAHLTFPVLSLGWVMTLIQQGMAAMGRINEILDYPVEDRSEMKVLDADELVFTAKNLSYRYPGNHQPSLSKIEGPVMAPPVVTMHGGETHGNVLQELSFTMKSGQTIAITGTIGSGKTTLINLMSGIFKPGPGMLFINNTDICDINPASLAMNISVVPQETFLFSRSIAENISLGIDGDMDLAKVKEAARNAGLAQDIETFPEQYEQILGERGITLSGGQKQRTAIARSLLKQSPVLIFDDALSSVDAKTEGHILENLTSLHSFKTLIVISHRISALKNADIIYVLDRGRIVEQGTHQELLEHKQLYAKLAKMQQMEVEIDDV
jgi:ATP-binding cassette subfamily B multidrug efflux pump